MALMVVSSDRPQRLWPEVGQVYGVHRWLLPYRIAVNRTRAMASGTSVGCGGQAARSSARFTGPDGVPAALARGPGKSRWPAGGSRIKGTTLCGQSAAGVQRPPPESTAARGRCTSSGTLSCRVAFGLEKKPSTCRGCSRPRTSSPGSRSSRSSRPAKDPLHTTDDLGELKRVYLVVTRVLPTPRLGSRPHNESPER